MKRIPLLLCLMITTLTSIGQGIPDYFMESVGFDQSSVNIGENFNIGFKIGIDDSQLDSLGVSYRIYLSEDNVLSTGDIAVRAGSTFADTVVTSFSINSNISLGEKHLIIKLNDAFSMIESNYSNNTFITEGTITITKAPQPDIQVINFLEPFPGTTEPGTPVQMELTLDGMIPQNFIVNYYLSSDSIFDTDDQFLAVSYINQISQETAYPPSFIMPDGTDEGEWHILAVVDPEGKIYESDETNNLGIYTMDVFPASNKDFIIESFSLASDSVLRGTSMILDLVLQELNIDNPFQTTSVALYFSADSMFSSDDRLARTFNSVQVGQNISNAVTIPTRFNEGYRYVIAVADDQLAYKETNEENNTFVYQFVVTKNPDPDLAFDEVLIPTTLSTGKDYIENYSIQNLEQFSPSISHEVVFFLSADSTLDQNDLPLSRNIAAVPANGSPATLTSAFKIPPGTPEGTYNLLGFVDYLDDIKETIESNNDTLIQVTVVNPDLNPTNLTTSLTTIGAGTSFNTIVDIANLSGSGYADVSSLAYYLSSDESIDAEDLVLGSRSIPAIAEAGSLADLGLALSIPKIIEAGAYFLIAQVDADSVLAETDETNNTTTSTIDVVLPDLEVKVPIINPSTIYAKGSVTLEYRIDNNATVSSPATTTKFYLSEDQELQIDEDYYLGVEAIEVIDSLGRSTDKSKSVTIPSVPAGDYSILFFVDADSLISESNEVNNLKISSITVTNPDIVPSNLTLDKEVFGLGEIGNLRLNFTNQGAGLISNTTYLLSLSGELLDEEIALAIDGVPA